MRSTSTPLVMALFAMACANDGARPPFRADSGGGSAGSASKPEGGTNSRAGRDASDGAEGGTGGGTDDPDPPMSSPDPPVVEPDGEDPPVVEPDGEDPPVVEPDDDDPPVVDPPHNDGSGLPCEVEKLLRARCQTCHSSSPVAGANVSLMTQADLTAPSKILAGVTVGVRSLQRMKDSLAPMPPAPAPRVPDETITALQAWLTAGSPPSTCDEPTDPVSNPYDAPPTCTSGAYWTAYDSGTPWMNPGLACIKCHRQYPSFAPAFTVAGTVFPTAHEPDKCWGVPATTGAQVIITDANGLERSLDVVSGGNFGAILSDLALPYRAKVVVGQNQRVMLTPQTNGDCNACHTQAGAQGALGRIIVP